MTFTVKIEKIFTPLDLTYLFIGALEYGSSHWLRDFSVNGGLSLKDESTCATLLEKELTVVFSTHEFNEDCPDSAIKTINKNSIEAALKKLVELKPDFGLDNHDASDTDSFLQYLLLGKIVYG